MVMIGTLAVLAASRAGSRPSELSGEMISALAPWAIIDWMSEISLFRSDWALVVISLIPRLDASSLIDWVSAIRNGLASFSDWAKPTVAFLRSSFSTPPAYLSKVQPDPLCSWTCWAAFCPPSPSELSELLVQAPSMSVSPTTATAAVFARSRRETSMRHSFHWGVWKSTHAGNCAPTIV